MTSEELRQKYRFLKLVAEQGVRTYHALNARGHIVMVHHLPSDSPETARLLTLRGPTSMLSAAFSPNGRRIVTSSADRTVKIWESASGVHETP